MGPLDFQWHEPSEQHPGVDLDAGDVLFHLDADSPEKLLQLYGAIIDHILTHCDTELNQAFPRAVRQSASFVSFHSISGDFGAAMRVMNSIVRNVLYLDILFNSDGDVEQAGVLKDSLIHSLVPNDLRASAFATSGLRISVHYQVDDFIVPAVHRAMLFPELNADVDA